MIFGGKGGANTKSGLAFEGKTDLATFLNAQKGYQVKEDKVFFEGELVGRIFKKHGILQVFRRIGNRMEKFNFQKITT